MTSFMNVLLYTLSLLCTIPWYTTIPTNNPIKAECVPSRAQSPGGRWWKKQIVVERLTRLDSTSNCHIFPKYKYSTQGRGQTRIKLQTVNLSIKFNKFNVLVHRYYHYIVSSWSKILINQVLIYQFFRIIVLFLMIGLNIE